MERIHCFDDFYLKILLPKDVTKRYVHWINDTETNKYLVTQKTTIEDCKKYVLDKYNNKNTFFYGIFHNSKHIGNIKIEKIDNKLNCGCLGVMIGDKHYRGKGYGTKLITFFGNYLFNNLPLDIIMLGVLKENIGAIKCYLKCGFKNIYDVNENTLHIVNKYLTKYHFSNASDRMYMLITK